MITTSDHALLTPQMVNYFLQKTEASGADISLAFVEKEILMERFPDSVRTYVPFSGEQVSGANLYAFQTRHGIRIPEFWSKVEKFRKRPLRMAVAFGPIMTVQYLLRRLSLKDAFMKASTVLGVSIHAVKMPFPEAAVDVDRVSDLELVLEILEERAASTE